jgi:hypothetical protein
MLFLLFYCLFKYIFLCVCVLVYVVCVYICVWVCVHQGEMLSHYDFRFWRHLVYTKLYFVEGMTKWLEHSFILPHKMTKKAKNILFSSSYSFIYSFMEKLINVYIKLNHYTILNNFYGVFWTIICSLYFLNNGSAVWAT